VDGRNNWLWGPPVESACARQTDQIFQRWRCCVGVLRAWHCHLRAGFQQCKSFVEMDTVRCCPLWHPAHCPMGTLPWVLVRRTASPEHAVSGGLSSGSARRPTRRRASPAQLFVADGGGLSVGLISVSNALHIALLTSPTQGTWRAAQLRALCFSLLLHSQLISSMYYTHAPQLLHALPPTHTLHAAFPH
jgi:hypothetical protein